MIATPPFSATCSTAIESPKIPIPSSKVIVSLPSSGWRTVQAVSAQSASTRCAGSGAFRDPHTMSPIRTVSTLSRTPATTSLSPVIGSPTPAVGAGEPPPLLHAARLIAASTPSPIFQEFIAFSPFLDLHVAAGASSARGLERPELSSGTHRLRAGPARRRLSKLEISNSFRFPLLPVSNATRPPFSGRYLLVRAYSGIAVVRQRRPRPFSLSLR